jgi:hypothetical protein
MVIGNKVDLVEHDARLRAVETEQTRAWATGLGMSYMETSCRNVGSVNAAFEQLARQVLIILSVFD